MVSEGDIALPLDHGGPVDWPYEPFPASALAGSVIDRFDAVASRFADRTAASDGARSVTYAQLATQVGHIAAAVDGAAAAQPGPVAILLGNEVGHLAAMLGVLASGRPYVGLDPNHPDERIRAIATHAGAVAVVSAGPDAVRARALLAPLPVVDLEAAPAGQKPSRRPQPDDIAWIIYTSGSTGAPKGVYQNHRGLIRDILESTVSLRLGPQDRQILFASPTLVSGMRVAFGSLLTGGLVHCLSPQDMKPESIAQLVNDLGITVFRSVPALFRNAVRGLGHGERFGTLRLVMLGGDRVDIDDYRAFGRVCGPHALFATHLGATECSSIYLQCFLPPGLALEGDRMPVGRAIPERDVTLVKDDGTPAADGELGEFRVTSRHLALGYWREPDLTAAAFTADADDPTRRTFRTGDIGRRRADGFYEHHGRRDHQFKLHGNRIEIGDIEDALRSCQGVRDGAVVVRHSDKGVPQAIAAYVELQPDIEGLLPRHVRAMLAERLPPYMLPAVIVLVEELPRLPNLKVDRMRLAEIDAEEVRRPRDPERDRLVVELIALFEASLSTSGATADDNVLSLGGDSLQAAVLAMTLSERFGVGINLDGGSLTIRDLAAQIAASREEAAAVPGSQVDA